MSDHNVASNVAIQEIRAWCQDHDSNSRRGSNPEDSSIVMWQDFFSGVLVISSTPHQKKKKKNVRCSVCKCAFVRGLCADDGSGRTYRLQELFAHIRQISSWRSLNLSASIVSVLRGR